jgi:hypothetical protein
MLKELYTSELRAAFAAKCVATKQLGILGYFAACETDTAPCALQSPYAGALP